MTMRTLLLCAALAASACNITVPPQFACPTPGKSLGCATGQICGPDKLCTADISCGSLQRCNGVCIDTTTDPNNCGNCGDQGAQYICDRTKGEVCQPPTTQGLKASCQTFCFHGQTDCGGTCRDTTGDPNNCGACGVICPAGDVCTNTGPNGAGQCTLKCQSGQTNCGGTCVDTSRDNRNCGTCGTLCPSGQACSGGVCGVSCPSPETNCSGQCANTASDRNNCGTCGTICAAGHVCQSGNCVTLSCPAPLSDCGGTTCINTNTDNQNCGGCTNPALGINHACAAGQSCIVVAGAPTCALLCPSGEAPCPTASPTTCANLATDPNNCGTCGTKCGAGLSCQGASGCKPTCKTGFTDCGGSLGCVDTLNDSNHCGGCATACGQGNVCQAGVCTPTCRTGQLVCPPPPATGGVCVDPQIDPNNCGGCQQPTTPTHKCAAGFACTGGNCQVECGANSTACGGTCVDINTDNQNCGGCTNLPNVNHVCGNGFVCNGSGVCAPTCGVGKTGAQLSICPPITGTCVDTTSDASNCGTCSHACNAGEVCQSSVCTVSCQAGLSQCASGTTFVCKDLTQDRTNCGTCGTTCQPGQVCAFNGSTYACTVSCQSPLTNCNGICTNVQTDPLNCGYCAGLTNPSNGVLGKACTAGPSGAAFCSAGQCNVACAPGYCQGTASAASPSPFCNAGGCSATPLGVQQNLLISDLTAGGWVQCYADTYAANATTTAIAAVQTACKFTTAGTSWLVGCGPAASGGTLNIAAVGAPSDVLFMTTAGNPRVVAATGIEWYFDGGNFGFAPANAPLVRGTPACDTAGSTADGFAGGFGSQRLCWLTTATNFVAGQRCGEQTVTDTSIQRFVFYK